MDDKVALINELVEEINHTKTSMCLQEEQFFQANILADDAIQKLLQLRNFLTNESLNVEERRSNDIIPMKKGPKQCLPPHPNNFREGKIINLKTEAVLNNDEVDLVEVARNAFENENYAKCVRTIERIAALQQSKLNPTLMDLCHKSYKKVIQSATTNSDRLKLCEWWRLFVESTQLDDCSNEALLCQIDWRSECLQERLKLAQTISERISISEMLIVGLIEAYEVTAQCSMPFSVANLKQRIDGLCSMISDHLRNTSETNKTSLVLEEGIELLRLIYSEARDELNEMHQTGTSSNSEKVLLEIMNEVRPVLEHCSWCDVSSHTSYESSPSNTIRTSSASDRSSSPTQELSTHTWLRL